MKAKIQTEINAEIKTENRTENKAENKAENRAETKTGNRAETETENKAEIKTEIIKIDSRNIDTDKLRYAAEVIKSGGLVAFPTETVYGLGANAFDETSVKKIFKAKGRPCDNPLIVHVAKKEDVYRLVKDIPPEASRLMDSFWPGPLTLVMNKSDAVPYAVTAGLDTVAIRMPSHPVALELIRMCRLPIAAPSANASGRPSPTSAAHVIDDLWGRIDVIIDSGNTDVGLESTVLDTTTSPYVILRPGGISPEELENVLHGISIDPSAIAETPLQNHTPRSPGVKYSHYSPRADVVIVEGKDLSKIVGKINSLIEEYGKKGVKVGVLATDQTKNLYHVPDVISVGDRQHPEIIASNLFNALREFDRRKVDLIFAEAIETCGIGLAVMNRLNKAAGYNIISV